jgi:arsenate reductase
MEIWINPACSKCSCALSLLDAEGAAYTVRRYLEEPPTADELEQVLRRLGLEPWDITRTGEAIAAELGMASWGREAAPWCEGTEASRCSGRLAGRASSGWAARVVGASRAAPGVRPVRRRGETLALTQGPEGLRRPHHSVDHLSVQATHPPIHPS